MCSLLVYRKTVGFCKSIWCPTTSWIHLIVLGGFSSLFVASLESSMQSFVSFISKESFISDQCAIYFFLAVLNWLKLANTMLNKSGEGGHLCLVLYFRGKASVSLSIKYDVRCRYFVDLIKLRNFPSIPIFLRAYIIVFYPGC